jgi:hypothetical protein
MTSRRHRFEIRFQIVDVVLGGLGELSSCAFAPISLLVRFVVLRQVVAPTEPLTASVTGVWSFVGMRTDMTLQMLEAFEDTPT